MENDILILWWINYKGRFVTVHKFGKKARKSDKIIPVGNIVAVNTVNSY